MVDAPTRKTRPWLARELVRIKELRAKNWTAAEIAQDLGRTQDTVEAMCYYYRLTKDRKKATRARHARVRRLYKLGYSALQIARKLGAGLDTIYRDHQRLQLKPQRMCCIAVGRKLQKRLRHYYGQSLTAEVRENERIESVRFGWPPVTQKVRAHLEKFERYGPGNARAHLERHGGSYNGVRNMLWKLLRDGHLVVVGREKRQGIYALAPAVRASRRIATAAQNHQGVTSCYKDRSCPPMT